MNCPIDGTQLAMAERHGVEIDYCPQCRGIWLDRGELDKIIEHADEYPSHGRDDYREDDRDRHDHDDDEHRGRSRRRNRLSDFFEGFGG